LTPDDTKNFTSIPRDISFYGSKTLAHVRLDYVAECNNSIVNIELQGQNKPNNIPRFFTYNYLLRQRYLTDHGIKDCISLPVVSILLCNYNIALNNEFKTEFPYYPDNKLQTMINQTIMRMFFVNIDLIPKKPLAEMSHFEQVCCFFKAETWEDLNFLSRNGGFMVEKAIKCYNEVIDDPMFILERNEFDLDFRNMVNDEVEVRIKQHNLEMTKIKDELLAKNNKLAMKDNKLIEINRKFVDLTDQFAQQGNKIAEQSNQIAELQKSNTQLTKLLVDSFAKLDSQNTAILSKLINLDKN
jgi:hypothetical protein